jgi:hypothetical protein
MLAAENTIRAPRMLDDISLTDVVDVPYPHYVRQNAVPPETYRQLEADFPSLQMILDGRTGYGNNEAVRMTVKQVLGDRRISPLWRGFFEYHTSAAYWRQIVRLMGDRFRAEFPDLEEKVGRRFEDWRVTPRGFSGDADIRLDCQFVMNTPVTEKTSVKTPHVDLCDKIFSALFYFRDPADATSGGNLDIYRWRRSPRFIKHRSLDRDVELVKTVPYAANTYLFFLNSAQAVHGVSPRDVTPIPRRYINFIAELPIKAFKPKQINRLQQMLYSGEVRAAAQDDRY